MNILLVEDNITISKGLMYSFKTYNYNLVCKATFKETKKYLEENDDIDLIILDVTLPDGNGFDLYKNYIIQKNIPTIFLTAIDTEDSIVNGIEMGADDYITKPFSTKELIARVNRIILKNKKYIVKIKDITYDFNKMEVRKKDDIVELSSLELKILNLLFININKVVNRNSILDKIWEWTGNDVDDHTVTVYLKRIREKLGTDIITTIKGIGYRIDEEK